MFPDKIADMLYWLFSTIAQTFGALLGILGMVIIFRLQQLLNVKDKYEDIGEKCISIICEEDVPKINIYSAIYGNAMEELEKMSNLAKQNDAYNTLINLKPGVIFADKSIQEMNNNFSKFVAIMLIVVVISIIYIFEVPFMTTSHYGWLIPCICYSILLTISLYSIKNLFVNLFDSFKVNKHNCQ